MKGGSWGTNVGFLRVLNPKKVSGLGFADEAGGRQRAGKHLIPHGFVQSSEAIDAVGWGLRQASQERRRLNHPILGTTHCHGRHNSAHCECVSWALRFMANWRGKRVMPRKKRKRGS